MSRVVLKVVLALLLTIALEGPAMPAWACACDCDGSGEVTIDEILTGLNIALGERPPGDCVVCDADQSGAVEVDEVVAAVNAALSGCPATPTPSVPSPTLTSVATPTPGLVATPIFPASYRNTFAEVRDCRFSVEHGGVAIRVLANPVAAGPYLRDENPLPVGSVVVKEEYVAADCKDDSKLIRWRAMRKETPGFDSDDGDWHWQWVNRDRTVAFDDKQTCIGCHLAPSCVARDYMCTVGSTRPQPPPLSFVFDGVAPALLGVSGTSPTNVIAVGADPHDGLGPYVLKYNGQCWARLRTGATGALWWISFNQIGGAFYMVGDGGLILRYDLSTNEFQRQLTPGSATLFGIWGERVDSIWAVGRDSVGEVGVLWHYDGGAWRPVDLSPLFPETVPVLFKIWGRNEHDVYAVGAAGTILHFDGERWGKIDSGTNRPLFTVHGNNDLVVATGGFGDGVIVEDDGSGFTNRAPRGIDQTNGVFVPPNGLAVGVGINASFALRDSSGWIITPTDLDTRRDFHAVWMDPEGGWWVVGGNLSEDLSDGILVYGGTRSIPTGITLDHCGDDAGAVTTFGPSARSDFALHTQALGN